MFKYTTDNTRRNNMETKGDTGCFVGVNSRTIEYLITRGVGFARRQHFDGWDDEAYDPEILKEVRILH